jgi:hypothetical protein
MNIYDENIYYENISLTVFNLLEIDTLDTQGKLVSIKSNVGSVTNTLQSNNKILLSKDPNIILPIQIEP